MNTVEWTEPGVGIATLGEIPVAGATAEITLAYLPSCAKYGVTLNFWLDYKNTSAETISVRPHIYLIGLASNAFLAKDLEPGQSYSEVSTHGWPWIGAVKTSEDFARVEAGIDVYTPEGWVEVDRVVGEPFEWSYTYPLPELTIISAPEYASPNSGVDIECEYYNPGFSNPPGGYVIANGENLGSCIFPPDMATPFTYHFIIHDQDTIITMTPYRNTPPPGTVPLAGEPVSVTIHVATVPMYHLDISINGEGLVLPEDVSGDYLEGTAIELTAYPAPGWWFHSWEGTDNDAANPTKVTMDSDKYVVAIFTEKRPAFNLEDWLPMLPWEGLPLPRFLQFFWPWYKGD